MTIVHYYFNAFVVISIKRAVVILGDVYCKYSNISKSEKANKKNQNDNIHSHVSHGTQST